MLKEHKYIVDLRVEKCDFGTNILGGCTSKTLV